MKNVFRFLFVSVVMVILAFGLISCDEKIAEVIPADEEKALIFADTESFVDAVSVAVYVPGLTVNPDSSVSTYLDCITSTGDATYSFNLKDVTWFPLENSYSGSVSYKKTKDGKVEESYNLIYAEKGKMPHSFKMTRVGTYHPKTGGIRYPEEVEFTIDGVKYLFVDDGSILV